MVPSTPGRMLPPPTISILDHLFQSDSGLEEGTRQVSFNEKGSMAIKGWNSAGPGKVRPRKFCERAVKYKL